jgi:hypothetical protein
MTCWDSTTAGVLDGALCSLLFTTVRMPSASCREHRGRTMPSAFDDKVKRIHSLPRAVRHNAYTQYEQFVDERCACIKIPQRV